MSRSTRVRALAGTTAAALAALGVFVSTSAGSSSSAPSTPRTLIRQATVFRATPTARSASTHYVYKASKVVSLAANHYTFGTITCPTSHPTPVSGLFGSNSTAVYISSSEPSKGGWYTRIDNASTTNAANVQIGVVCGA